MVSLLKNHQLENFRLAIVDLSSICFDFGLFSKNFLAPSVTFKFSRTKVITHALYYSSLPVTAAAAAAVMRALQSVKAAQIFCNATLVRNGHICRSMYLFYLYDLWHLLRVFENHSKIFR